MPTIDELKKVRLEKLETLKKMGVDPYPADVSRDHTVSEAREANGKTVVIAGRVMSMRGHGKIVFSDVVDSTGKIQVVLKKDVLDENSQKLVDLLDIGDFIEAKGNVESTQAGEISVFAASIRIIAKAVRPLPDQWHGLKDVEERYRQRYVDLVVNPGVRELFLMRTKVVQFLRAFLDKDEFVEVETPVLQPLYGGASAKPFVTHHNALDTDLYLRISDELYLKRLIVGGFDRVYEISKDFRNEGIDRQHNPEFTMLEFYWAYANYDDLMKYTETMLSQLVEKVKGSMKFTYQGEELDFTPPWPRKTYRDIVLEFTGIDINEADTEKKLLAAIQEKHIRLDLEGVVGFGAMLDTLYKATARPHLTGPMFLTDRPTAFVALAKRLPHDPSKTASFQLLVVGKEILNAYNELNDPADQEARWRESEELGSKGQDEHENVDADYIRALEYGMPPTAGWGMGIDRLVSILTDQASLKEVILFPTLRPEFEQAAKPVSAPKKMKQETIDPSHLVSKEKAMELLHAHMQNPNLRRHCYAVGYTMRALAEKLGGNPDVWEVMGILHDADWEETKDAPDQHTIKTIAWLKELGITEGPLVRALQSHNNRLTNLGELNGLMEWALETCDELTGFIVAVALILPDKKLSAVTPESVMKKWGKKEFAKGVIREQIAQCEEKLGIPLPEFIALTLKTMQDHHEELGL
jgi:lysyl-tRNA synthetase, class II